MDQPLDISRRNPQEEYDLIQRVGSGTYGDVYKVSDNCLLTIKNGISYPSLPFPLCLPLFDFRPLLSPLLHIITNNNVFCAAFQAKRLSNGELAAIKIIKLEPGDEFSIIQQEILMMKDCRHPNVVAFFGSYLRRDKLWICMEFCGGGSLQDIYHCTGPLG